MDKNMILFISFIAALSVLSLSACESKAPEVITRQVTAQCEKRVVTDQDPDICQYQSDCQSSCFYTCKAEKLVQVKDTASYFQDVNKTRWCTCTCTSDTRQQVIRD